MATAQLFAFPDTAPSMVDPPKKPKSPKQKGYTQEFDDSVWKPYPRKLNCSKWDAFRAWNKLTVDEQALVIAAMPIVALSYARTEENKIPHLSTWLNGRRFETVVIPSTEPQETINIDWPMVLKIYSKTNNWNHAYGPAPDQHGYRGPK